MNSYQDIIDKYVKEMKEELKEELELLLIIGSGSSSKVIPGWSDIDVILVVTHYTFELLEKIKKISNLYDVKIGTTIYTKKEFKNLNIDSKTYYHLYLLQNQMIKIQYKKDNIKLRSYLGKKNKNKILQHSLSVAFLITLNRGKTSFYYTLDLIFSIFFY